jgi:signal transduction histidine kinase
VGVRLSRANLLLTLARDSCKLCWLAFVAFLLLTAAITAAALIPVWVGVPLLLRIADYVRGLANAERARVRERLHVSLPAATSGESVGRAHVRLRARIHDPMTQRELWWLSYQGTAGIVLTSFSAAECLLHLVLLWLPGPYLLTLHSRCSIRILATSGNDGLADRVSELTRWRTRTVDSQAAELRRIERDLHDGAQARLIALSLNLGMADALFEDEPAEARQMVLEARHMSGEVLAELRQLVRGIYPPVLSERGLGDAVRALALIAPVTVEVDVELPPRRFAAALESAAYFAVSETLTNAVKHSRASVVRIKICVAEDVLRMSVTDDGIGGVDPTEGTGLTGLRHRLAAFDGVLKITSPAGGPTEIVMEVPCASS